MRFEVTVIVTIIPMVIPSSQTQLNHVESTHTFIVGLYSIGTVQCHETEADLLTNMKLR